MFGPQDIFPELERINQKLSDGAGRFGKIDSNYTGIGRPQVIYDIDIQSGVLSKPLPYLDSYTPSAGDRVYIQNGIIVGKIV